MDVSILTTNLTGTTNMDIAQVVPMPSNTTTWPQVFMYLLLALVPAIPALMGYIKTITIARKQAENKVSLDEKLKENTNLTAKTQDKLCEVHDQVNGKMQALIDAKVAEALAKGKELGKQEVANVVVIKEEKLP